MGGFFLTKKITTMRVLFLLFFLVSVNIHAQQEDTLVYEVQDKEPEFPGGFSEMLSWVQKSLINVNFSQEEATCFSNIFVEFIVEKDGSLSNIKARNKCNSDLSHFIELFENSPKWEPGKYKNTIVRSRCRIPLQIELNQY